VREKSQQSIIPYLAISFGLHLALLILMIFFSGLDSKSLIKAKILSQAIKVDIVDLPELSLKEMKTLKATRSDQEVIKKGERVEEATVAENGRPVDFSSALGDFGKYRVRSKKKKKNANKDRNRQRAKRLLGQSEKILLKGNRLSRGGQSGKRVLGLT